MVESLAARAGTVHHAPDGGAVAGILGFAATGVFVLLAALHAYWALGGTAAQGAVIPTQNGAPVMRPSNAATWVVALLLTAAAAVVLGRLGVLGGVAPAWVFRIGAWGLALVLLARAIGDFRWVGFFKRPKGTRFADMDSALYSPLCLALAAACAVVAGLGGGE